MQHSGLYLSGEHMASRFLKASGFLRLLALFLLAPAVTLVAQQPAGFSATHSGKNEFVIKNATLLTTTHGRIEKGSVYVKDGKIVAFGASVSAPSSAAVIDAEGKYVTPGIIDPHSHMALDGDSQRGYQPGGAADDDEGRLRLQRQGHLSRAGGRRHLIAAVARLGRHDRRPSRGHQEQVRP
ncbi:MAG TPA: hypothetical protein VN620_17290, partial [Candidatus Methylomirabilis sp.]|nr:hypothetical protein [Candidatus Methylomirabilis sp.]